MLEWKPMKQFPGEYECRVGILEFSVSNEGHWDVSACFHGSPKRSVTICSGQCATLKQAQNKCNQVFSRQFKAMQKLPLFSTTAARLDGR